MLRRKNEHTPGLHYPTSGTICLIEYQIAALIDVTQSRYCLSGKLLVNILNYVVHKLSKIEMFNKNNTCSKITQIFS